MSHKLLKEFKISRGNIGMLEGFMPIVDGLPNLPKRERRRINRVRRRYHKKHGRQHG